MNLEHDHYDPTPRESTGARLARLRRERNITQESLAERLDVSRQAVSKWESDLAYPETDKLLKLSRLYGCTVDYLLTGEGAGGDTTVHTSTDDPTNHRTEEPIDTAPCNLHDRVSGAWGQRPRWYYEYKSRRTVRGLPLIHINIGWGRRAHGVIAIGLLSRGILSLGVCSLGVLSLGVCSLGLISLGAFALGLAALGSIAAGAVAVGAIAVGLLAIGALAVGLVSVGALAVGHFFAMGDWAYGGITLGNTVSQGTVFAYLGDYPVPADKLSHMGSLLDTHCPPVFREIAAWLARTVSRLGM